MATDVLDGNGKVIIRGDAAANRGMDRLKPFYTRAVDATGADVVPGGSGATGSVTPAGTNGTQAQSVQGINGGVPVLTSAVDTKGIATLDLTNTANVVTLAVPAGASVLEFQVGGVSGSGASISAATMSIDGATFYSGTMTNFGGVSAGVTGLTADIAPNFISVAGLNFVQFNIQTAGTGTATIRYTFSTATPRPQSGLSVSSAGGGVSNVSRVVSSAATTNATLAKAAIGRLYKITGFNAAASIRWLRFYNTAAAPVPGTTAAYFALPLPPGAFSFDAMDIGYTFSVGIGYAITTGAADADATAPAAGDILNLNVWYR